MTEQTARDRSSAISSLWTTSKYSDLTVRCKTEVFSVHCAIVCTQSEFFRLEVDGCSTGSSAREVDLLDDDPAVINAVLGYLYTGDYNDVLEQATPSFALVFNTDVFVAANKFHVPALCTLAVKKYKDKAKEVWDSPEFTLSAKLVFNSIEGYDESELNGVIIETASMHIDGLLGRSEFGELIKQGGVFALEVLKASRRIRVADVAVEESTMSDSVSEAENIWGAGKKRSKHKRSY